MGYEPLYHALQIFWCIFIFILFFYILGTLLMKQLPLTTQTLADKPYSFTQNFCNKLGIQLICNKYQRKVKHMFKSVNISCSYNYKAKIMGEGVTYSLFSMLVYAGLHQWSNDIYVTHLSQDSTFDLLWEAKRVSTWWRGPTWEGGQ